MVSDLHNSNYDSKMCGQIFCAEIVTCKWVVRMCSGVSLFMIMCKVGFVASSVELWYFTVSRLGCGRDETLSWTVWCVCVSVCVCVCTLRERKR